MVLCQGSEESCAWDRSQLIADQGKLLSVCECQRDGGGTGHTPGLAAVAPGCQIIPVFSEKLEILKSSHFQMLDQKGKEKKILLKKTVPQSKQNMSLGHTHPQATQRHFLGVQTTVFLVHTIFF